MLDETPDLEVDDSDNIVEDDKTSEKNEVHLDDLPDEDEVGGEKKEDKKDDDGKKSSSAIAQKIKARAELKAEREKSRKLEEEIVGFKKDKDKPSDEKEAAAQKYIREVVREEMKNMSTAEKRQVTEAQEALAEQMEEVLEENSAFTEKQVLDCCEEYEVEPRIAAKILSKQGTPKKEKPRAPSSGRAPTSSDADEAAKPKKGDAGKTMHQIGEEIKKSIKSFTSGK